ncbi:MAG TPA: YkvA family protein [Candidatus Limnocylindrales bacterium]
MTEDPFPRERVTTMLRRMPAYLRLSWRLAKDPLLSKARRAAVVGAAGYLASPIDLVPGVIPVIGQLDDIAVALAAIRIALAGLSPERRAVHLDAVGLADQDLADDLRTVGATAGWIGRAGFRTTKRVAVAGARAAGAAARTTKAGLDRATPMAKATADRVTPTARAMAARAAPVTNAASPAIRAVSDRAGPAANAVVAKAAPVARATGRTAKGAGATAMKVGGRVAGATIRRLPKRGSPQPRMSISRVDVRLLPPPPPRGVEG